MHLLVADINVVLLVFNSIIDLSFYSKNQNYINSKYH